MTASLTDWQYRKEQIGHPYRDDPSPREPHTMFNWESGLPTFTSFIQKPTPAEILAFRRDPVNVGFLLEEPVLWTFFHIQDIHSADAPFTPHLVHPMTRHFPELQTPHTRYFLNLIMADASDGTVLAIRQGTLSPENSRYLLDSTMALLSGPFDSQEYDRAIADFYQRHPTSEGPVISLAEHSAPLGA